MPALDYRDRIRQAYVGRFACDEDLDELTQFPNMEFEPPDAEPGAKWARLTIEESSRRKVSLASSPGTEQYRVLGSMVVQLFTPPGEGTRQALDLANTLMSKFQSVTVEGVVYRTPFHRLLGRSGDWHQTNVVCPFYFDELI